MYREPLLGGTGENFSFIVSSLTRMNNNVKVLSELVDQIGTRSDTQQLRQRITQNREETIALVRSIRDALQKPYDVRQQKIQHDKLATQFQDLLSVFERISRLSLKKEKEVVVQLEGRRRDSIDGSPVFRQQQAQLPSGMQVLDVESAMIEERNREIKDLERDLAQLAECFSDMAQMVEQQGELINNTESAVVAAEEQVAQGAVELEAAKNYQNSARKKILILIICCLCLIGIGAGIGVWQYFKNK
eukprot:TRINITY_DN2815_c0_g1_i1.p1 TRINITY_DN2815_c0_g1~~TRINITY_DN2815_c0_g1_i1.p1  ORF type:complete len:246 (-),score=42.60 TRINITY_DN2815_c0_g1_i1:237-974(-)